MGGITWHVLLKIKCHFPNKNAVFDKKAQAVQLSVIFQKTGLDQLDDCGQFLQKLSTSFAGIGLAQ